MALRYVLQRGSAWPVAGPVSTGVEKEESATTGFRLPSPRRVAVPSTPSRSSTCNVVTNQTDTQISSSLNKIRNIYVVIREVAMGGLWWENVQGFWLVNRKKVDEPLVKTRAQVGEQH